MHICKKRFYFWMLDIYRGYIGGFFIFTTVMTMAHLYIAPAVLFAVHYINIEFDYAKWERDFIFCLWISFFAAIVQSIARWIACPNLSHYRKLKQKDKYTPANRKKIQYWIFHVFIFGMAESVLLTSLAFMAYFKIFYPSYKWLETGAFEVYFWEKAPWENLIGGDRPLILMPAIFGAVAITLIRWRRWQNRKKLKPKQSTSP